MYVTACLTDMVYDWQLNGVNYCHLQAANFFAHSSRSKAKFRRRRAKWLQSARAGSLASYSGYLQPLHYGLDLRMQFRSSSADPLQHQTKQIHVPTWQLKETSGRRQWLLRQWLLLLDFQAEWHSLVARLIQELRKLRLLPSSPHLAYI